MRFFNALKEAPYSFLYQVLFEDSCSQISFFSFGAPCFLILSIAIHSRGEKITEGIMFSCTKGSFTHWILGTVLHLCIILLNQYDSVNA